MTLERQRWLSRALGAIFCAILISQSNPGAAQQMELPAGPNRELVYGACQPCHDLQYLQDSAGIPRDAWDAAIDDMRQYGLRIPAEQRAKILDYLATYLGPNPPPAAPVAAAEPKEVNGAELFEEQCSVCHQLDGKGVAGQFPPLAGNHDLFRDRLLPVYVLLNGLAGKIEVEGRDFDAEMPPVAHLSDAEIAAVINYVRGAWTNKSLKPSGMEPIDPATVQAARAKKMQPADVRAYREQLR